MLRTNSDIFIYYQNGNEIAFFDIIEGNHLVSSAISRDGTMFAVAFSAEDESQSVALYDINFGEEWRQSVTSYSDVALDDRMRLFATVRGGNTYVWDRRGDLLERWTGGGLNIAVDRSGQRFVIGNWGDDYVYTTGLD